MGIDNPGITDSARAILKNHSWPGNVRELVNAIQKALIFNRGAPISKEEIQQAISEQAPEKSADQVRGIEAIRSWVRRTLALEKDENMFDACMDEFASILISEALSLTAGNRSRAAKLLGLSRPTLHSKIDKYKLKIETSVKTD